MLERIDDFDEFFFSSFVLERVKCRKRDWYELNRVRGVLFRRKERNAGALEENTRGPERMVITGTFRAFLRGIIMKVFGPKVRTEDHLWQSREKKMRK